jgi:flagellum-specific ATP synthase
MLPRLLERSGKLEHGSITGLYTVLVDQDDMDEPIADAMRSILDGHIVLSRRLASMNHYPAIDVLPSISRVMIDVVTAEHRRKVNGILEMLSTYREAEDLINIGAYQPGSNPGIDKAIRSIDAINKFLRQDINEHTSFAQTLERLNELHEKVEAPPAPPGGQQQQPQPRQMQQQAAQQAQRQQPPRPQPQGQAQQRR